MTKRISKELRREMARIRKRSVRFWEWNKDACRYENAIARMNAQQRIKETLLKGKDIRV